MFKKWNNKKIIVPMKMMIQKNINAKQKIYKLNMNQRKG